MSQEEYEDDFEDYEDDFEESEHEAEEVVKIEKKVEEAAQSQILQRLANRQASEPEKPLVTSVQRESLQTYNFSSVNVGEHALHQERAKERLQKLRGLINIERSQTIVITDATFDIFPAIFSDASGQSNAITQTGSQGISEEVQTEIAKTETISTQHPPHHSADWNGQAQYDRVRLKGFVAAAAQVMLTLLDSNSISSDEDQMRENGNFKFSRGHNTFHLGNLAKKNKVASICPGDSNTILVAYQIGESPSQQLDGKFLIVEFYVHRKGPPKRLFLADCAVQKMKMSPKLGVFYAALTDGSICAYDLMESESKLTETLPWVDSKKDLPLRRPAFDSSFMAATISDACSLVAIEVLPSFSGEQAVTIDTRGSMSFWLAERLNNNLNMQLTAVLRPHQHLFRTSPEFTVNCMVATARPLCFFIGCDSGMLFSQTRQETTQNIPKIYKSDPKMNGEVTSLSIHPSDSSIFMAGFSAGKVALFKTGQLSPLVWFMKKGSQRILDVFFNPRETMVFHAVSSGKMLSTWDLTKDLNAISSEKIDENAEISCASIWYSEKDARFCYLALGWANGGLDVHALENFSKPGVESLAKVIRKLKNF